MIKIAVLTNQQICQAQIKEITEKSMPLSDISYDLKEYLQPQELFDGLSTGEVYDIFLLDMDIPEYSCFETAHHIKIKVPDSAIIYITNQVDYAPGAYESNPYRYIPKKQLSAMLPKAYKAFCKRIEKRKWETLYYIPEGGGLSERISFRDIYYIKKEGKSTRIVHKNGQFRAETPFPEILKEFIANSCFSVIRKNCAVNILHVISFREYRIHLRDGSLLSIDGKYKDLFLKDILNCWNDFSLNTEAIQN